MSNPNNLLNKETSPYLLQHADNPVNWFAWEQQALDRARKENKPILLSVGYSACHWCHVMAHESFEDTHTAKLMNENFINIKVDREERPDLDKIYQTAHSMLTGRPGGWPLTVFLTPDDQMPFFAGTYFPKQRQHGMPAFSEILLLVKDAYQSKQADIQKQNQSLKAMLSQNDHYDKNATQQLNALPLDLARKQLIGEFDHINGGFSKAPKFPHPSMLERCLRHWKLSTQHTHDEDILDAAIYTLEKMALGGVFDHLAGGFCRYSTDDQWMIPHFEKMLYDNGQLLSLYCNAYQVNNQELFRQTAEGIANWTMNEMQSPQGGYFSAVDADSEGKEGKFYVWTPEEISKLLDEKDYVVFAAMYGLDRAANFEGKWHLHTYQTTEQLSDKFELDIEAIHKSITTAKSKLLSERSTRIPPGIDDKILTSWNALTIKGMCQAGRILNRSEFIHSASKAIDFVKNNIWKDGRFMATYKDGYAHINAYLDDYAYMLDALLEFLQCNWDNSIFAWCREIADALLEHFEDKNHGGFYFTSHDHETLIQRSKSFADEAIPAGNGVAAFALQRLGLLTADNRYLTSAENCLKAGAIDLQQHAVLNCSFLHALEEYLYKPRMIILRGDTDNLSDWQAIVNSTYLPSTLCFAITDDIAPPPPVDQKTPMLETCAYVCEGMHCLPAITDIEQFKDYLQQ